MRGVCVMKRKKKSPKKNYEIEENKNPSKGGINRRRKRAIERIKQRVEIMPPKLPASQLADYIEQYQPMVIEANKRITDILEAGYNSLAVGRVEEQTGREYFTLDFVENRGDLIAMVTAMRTFLADKGSTLEGAKEETVLAIREKYKHKFGNEYNTEEHNFARYDTTTIKKEDAEQAFEIYRKLEGEYAGFIGRQGGDGVYGSENLIIAIYDAVIKSKDNKNIDAYSVGEEELKDFIRNSNESWQLIQKEANYTQPISGYYDDNLKGGWNF